MLHVGMRNFGFREVDRTDTWIAANVEEDEGEREAKENGMGEWYGNAYMIRLQKGKSQAGEKLEWRGWSVCYGGTW
jgi:hypothetical protein